MKTEPLTREHYISRCFAFLDRHSPPSLPARPLELCRSEGIETVKLSDMLRSAPDMTREEIYAVWGNKDGVSFAGKNGGGRIFYNDGQTVHRVRFTICEELMHLVLGHHDNGNFRLTRQSWSDEEYGRIEREAKNGACLILCPPGYYLRQKPRLREIVARCNVSDACAASIVSFYSENEDMLRTAFISSRQKHVTYPPGVFAAPLSRDENNEWIY